MEFSAIYLFEDTGGADLAPVTTWNAPWELLIGTQCLINRVQQAFPQTPIQGVRTGEHISLKSGHCLFLNGRLLSLLSIAWEEKIYMVENQLAAAVLNVPENQEGELWPWLENHSKELEKQTTELSLGRYFWDYVYGNGSLIRSDAEYYALGQQQGSVHPQAVLLNPEQIFLGPESQLAPGVVLDATKGPIIIAQKVSIGANSVITGPVFIGEESIINPLTIIRPDVSIGHHCKIGGEIGSTIMMPYSNKGHYGYLGRSLVGSWCNLGAGSATSTIKNTYGDISFGSEQGSVETNQHSLGSLIGDHVKIGTNTVLSPGSSIGAFSNLFGSGSVPRNLAPFTWLDTASTPQEFALDKALEVASRVLARRGLTLEENSKLAMQALFEKTSSLRQRV